MSTISASTLTTTALQLTADTAGTLVFKTGATPTTALTLGADQSATFAGTVNFSTAGFTNLSVTGVATFSAGTVSLPSITTAGDTNTGIFFPAADTIAFTEGGVEAMRIDSNGNVGIGTSSPTAKLDVNGGIVATKVDLGGQTTSSIGAGNASIMKNRIINGAMVIDQRNAGASVSAATAFQYVVDRFKNYGSVNSKFTSQQNAGSITPPAGFTNYLGNTSSSAYSISSGDEFIIAQVIEGYNIADLNWGTANAKTVTLSFWAYSSLTGTFGGALRNSANTRSYPFSYSIPVANTWTQIAITIAGDTTGTWLTTNGAGIQVFWGLGVGSTYSGTAGAWSANAYDSATGAVSVVGTNGATFYITGVQLEVGSSATGFEYVNYQTSLANCQRYYQLISGLSGTTGGSGGTLAYCSINFPIEMRATPTAGQTGVIAFETPFGAASTQSSIATNVISNATNNKGMYVAFQNLSGLSANYPVNKYNNTNALTLSAEL